MKSQEKQQNKNKKENRKQVHMHTGNTKVGQDHRRALYSYFFKIH